MDHKRYVLLTGAKNNAGDFLIKDRANRLLNYLRPDRDLVNMNAWEPLDRKRLNIVNNSQALLLAGGPSLRPFMYPGIYPLVENLDEIKVPIILFGVGWKDQKGDWENTYNYPLNPSTIKLLKRVFSSSYYSSVRDYHTHHVLQNAGFEKVLMTGCPALYDVDHLQSNFSFPGKLRRIGFSLGVGHVKSREMEDLVKQILLKIKTQFHETDLCVFFHHSIDPEKYNSAYQSGKQLLNKNMRFARWLDNVNIEYKDISGSERHLIESYSTIDLHIGFRVHAHIFMSSISKPSILISEDGRGKALRSVLGGVVLDGFEWDSNKNVSTFLYKALVKLGVFSSGPAVNNVLPDLTAKTITLEVEQNYPRMSTVRNRINAHYQVMNNFINQLP